MHLAKKYHENPKHMISSMCLFSQQTSKERERERHALTLEGSGNVHDKVRFDNRIYIVDEIISRNFDGLAVMTVLF